MIAVIDSQGNSEWITISVTEGVNKNVTGGEVKNLMREEFKADTGSYPPEPGTVFSDKSSRDRICALATPGGYSVTSTTSSWYWVNKKWSYVYSGTSWRAVQSKQPCSWVTVTGGPNEGNREWQCTAAYNRRLESVVCTASSQLKMTRDDGSVI